MLRTLMLAALAVGFTSLAAPPAAAAVWPAVDAQVIIQPRIVIGNPQPVVRERVVVERERPVVRERVIVERPRPVVRERIVIVEKHPKHKHKHKHEKHYYQDRHPHHPGYPGYYDRPVEKVVVIRR